MYTFNSLNDALSVYKNLFLVRRCQEKIQELYPKGLIRTPVHLGIGLEWISVGTAFALPKSAKSFGQLRNHGQFLSLTGDTERFFGELLGRANGTGQGIAGSMHLLSPSAGIITASGIVGYTIPLAVGAAFASNYLKTETLSAVMFGDGAMEEGEFWESLNFSCLHHLPLLFICEDNGLAVHTSSLERKGYSSAVGVVKGFDCHTYEGDGTDVRTVIGLVQQAINAISMDPKPAFLNLTYYRFLEHVGPKTDFHIGYRPMPTEAELIHWDPVKKFEDFLSNYPVHTNDIKLIQDKVNEQIEISVETALAAPFLSSTEDLYKDVFA